MILDLIKCHILNKHSECWLLGEEDGSIIAMCPKCCKKVIKVNDNLFITYKNKESAK